MELSLLSGIIITTAASTELPIDLMDGIVNEIDSKYCPAGSDSLIPPSLLEQFHDFASDCF